MTDLSEARQRLVDAWLDNQWLERGLSRNTLENYGRDLRQFGDWLNREEHTPLEQCQRHQLLQFLAHRHEQGLGARSVARQLSALKSFFRW
ncbi:MAG: site-specific integrase, partial [Alloalcanivorax xenomutans]